MRRGSQTSSFTWVCSTTAREPLARRTRNSPTAHNNRTEHSVALPENCASARVGLALVTAFFYRLLARTVAKYLASRKELPT